MPQTSIQLSNLSPVTELIPPPAQEELASVTRNRSVLETFLSSFLKDQNIRWLLMVGAAIVFGSSLMLVTRAWPDWPPVLKYLSILAYTAATFFSAEFARCRLKIQTTYKMLYGLTLLLMPVCFMALMWLSAGTSTQQVLQSIEVIGLLLPATGFLWIASRQILDHLLSGRQSTFLNCYRLLCIAGVLPKLHSEATAFVFTLCCWIVFTVGVIKVNRHTFWLAEEHRFPRVFGFFPILMLGLQFLILVGTKAVSAVPPQWCGLCCVLLSFTVLMTSRAVANVFRKRTGNLIRPLPWNIMTPLVFGLVLMVLGVALSFNGFRLVGQTTFAVIPTAAVAATVMWMMARDFQSSWFVWCSLILAAISYQFSPTLFADLVLVIRNGAAGVLREDRLPVAFYGLTYLPLIAAVAAGSRRHAIAGDQIFSRPMKHFASLLSGVLFALSLTHTKAAFFVALVNIPAFIGLAVVFRDRRYVLPSILAVVIAAGSGIPALTSMGLVTVSPNSVPVVLAALAFLMTLTSTPDRLLNRIPLPERSFLRHRSSPADVPPESSFLLNRADGTHRNLSQLIGYLLAALISFHWLASAAITLHQSITNAQLLQYVLVLAACLLYAFRHPRYLCGLGFWTMVLVGSLRAAFGLDLSSLHLLNAVTIISAGTSLLSYAGLRFTGVITSGPELQKLRTWIIEGSHTDRTYSIVCADEHTAYGPRISGSRRCVRLTAAFLIPFFDLSVVILCSLMFFVHFPSILLTHMTLLSSSVTSVLPLSTGISVVWLAAAAMLFRSRVAGILATLTIPLWVTALIISSGLSVATAWFPVIWTAIYSFVLLGSRRFSSERAGKRVTDAGTFAQTSRGIDSDAATLSEWILTAILLSSCMWFDLPLRLAAAIILLVFAIIDRRHRTDLSRTTWLAVMANLQVFMLVAAVSGCRGSLAQLFPGTGSTSAVPMLFLTGALSLGCFDRMSMFMEPVICRAWTAVVRAGMVLLAATSLAGFCWSPELVALMIAGFAVALVVELVQAVRIQQEAFVWSGLAAATTGFVFLVTQGFIQMGAGLSQFVLLGLAVLALTVGRLSEFRSRLIILQRPMFLIGRIVPAVIACMAVGRHLRGMITLTASGNSMALMLASAIYFQQAMVTRQRRFAVLAVAILDMALMLLWKSLHLNHAEFYLVPVGLSVLGFVELLGKELPRKAHDPLRYLGALIILVSPMFNILDGSWGHVLSLLLLSVIVILLSVGLRLKSLVYTGSAFLLTDLIVMVIRSHVSYPFVPWLCGIALGIAVIAFAAFCENHREKVLSRIRFLSAELATWR